MRNGLRQAWLRNNFLPAAVSGDGKNKAMKSAVSLNLFDCKNGEFSTLQYVEYDDLFGRGVSGYSYSQTRSETVAAMQSTIPGSNGEVNARFVCAYPLK